MYNIYIYIYIYTLRPLCGYHFSTRRRRRIPRRRIPLGLGIYEYQQYQQRAGSCYDCNTGSAVPHLRDLANLTKHAFEPLTGFKRRRFPRDEFTGFKSNHPLVRKPNQEANHCTWYCMLRPPVSRKCNAGTRLL